ncbi:hypothetical protein C2S52_016759 [Perilla frutescens var. hirtella]|nr:hypothetical protein C2S52_016759 [Perilla frutescens var. hirtella]
MSSAATNPSKTSPWLMLPPAYEKRGGGMAYRFYSLADNEVLSFEKSDGVESPDDDARVVGSSHGWLALLNRRNNDLFLSNPLSRRDIKLPPIDALPNSEMNCWKIGFNKVSVTHFIRFFVTGIFNFGGIKYRTIALCLRRNLAGFVVLLLEGRSRFIFERQPPNPRLKRDYMNILHGRGRVSKVILSGRPDEGECLAMMSFGPGDRLAFCRPEHSVEWSPIGQLFVEPEDTTIKYGRVYEDFVYSSRKKVFNCLTILSDDEKFMFEDWDLRGAPKIDWIQQDKLLNIKIGDDDKYRYKWLGDETAIISTMKHLVYAEQSDQLFLLFRYMGKNPYKTVGFIVTRVVKEEEEEGGKARLVGCSLDGLALFVGTNHSFSVSSPYLPTHSSIYISSFHFKLIHKSFN